ncbi:hypothetical protein [Bdellovibrio sp. HCB337]|uniref:hypothetical protein n=1 Tax=Bdellovibrio sp. HCB337 TaxID=3394358 RepID=UPI0039A42157
MKSVLFFVAVFLFLTTSSAQEGSAAPAAATPVEAATPAPVATPAPTPVPTPVPPPAPVPVAAPAATPAPIVVIKPIEEAPPSLRKRQHAMSWQYKTSSVKSDFTPVLGTTSSSDISRGTLQFSYYYNWGHFELGVGAGSSVVTDNDTSDSDAFGSFVVGGMVNFIENAPGNNLIPYVGFAAGSTNENIDISGSKTRLIGGIGAFAFGLKWFPLEEIFAVDVSISSSSSSATASGANVGDYTATTGGFDVGFLLYF